MKLFYCVLMAFFGMSCGTSENFSYEFEQNGCKTGKHSFPKLQEMCAALKDNARNKNCAQSLREDYFAKKCSGSFYPH